MCLPLSFFFFFLINMEDKLLFLNSLGRYTGASQNAVKLPSGAKRGAQRKSQREKSEKTKRGVPSYTPDVSDSYLKIVVKNEPEEDSWDLELNADTDFLPDDSSQSQQGAERERQRNIRFSDEENDVLIKSVMPHYEKLFGRLAARHSTVAKNTLWREITSAVNAVSACPRSVQNCKKRFADIKRKVKEKLNRIDKHRRTSGGASRLHISFWPYERVMEKIIATDVVPGVPGTTDSGRVAEHESSDFHDLAEEDEAGNTEGEDCPSGHNEEQEEFPEEADVETEGGTGPEEPTRDGSLSLQQDHVSSRRQQTLRDHTSLIYAEQSHFRRTVAQKLNILNNNVKALNKNVKAFQNSFSESMAVLSQSMQQQNTILDKLSSNLLLLAEQQQQHNKQCMNGMQQVLHHLDVHQVSPSPTPSDSASDSSPLPVDARRGPHWRRVRRRSKSQISPEHTPKKGRH